MDFLAILADYNLTDLIKVGGAYMTPLNSDVLMINGEFIYSLKQDVELKMGVNILKNEEGTMLAENNSIFPAENLS